MWRISLVYDAVALYCRGREFGSLDRGWIVQTYRQMRSTLSRLRARARLLPGWTAAAVLALLMVAASGLSFANIGTGGHSALLTPGPLDELGLTGEAIDPLARRALHLPPAEHGAVVTSTRAGGPAARAGVRVGDVIERVGGLRVDGRRTLTQAVDGNDTRTVRLAILRKHRHIHAWVERQRMGG